MGEVSTRTETVTASDGSGRFAAHCAVPASGRGPGVLLFQEIFGVNDNMRGLARRLADAGFVVLVPDMFWRIEPGFERNDDTAMAEAFAMVQRYDAAKGLEDINATHAHLLSLPECTGKVGALGFCLGGTLAFAAATTSRVGGRGPDAAVCYYGSAINDMLGLVDRLECPAMFHYGVRDPYIPAEKVDEVERAVAGRPGVAFHRYDAGHAFSNWDAPSFYDQAAADEAWPRTVAFLTAHLG